MRSPFHYFRKHQKVLLAVFGVALMIVFTVGSVILQYLGSPGTQDVDEGTAVTFKGGKLTLAQLDYLRDQHNMVVAYLEEVALQARQKNGTPRQRIIGRGDSDEALLHSHLLATKAREMGIVISDQAIIDYLTELSDDKLPTADFGQILKKRLGSRMTEDHLFDALREELAAKAVEEFVIGGLTTLAPDRAQEFVIEPSRAWEYYCRLNREITAEILPLKVSDYIAGIPEPTEAQVEALYDEYKDKLSFPNDPEPGFKQRDKIALQFVKADYNQLLGEEKAKISDAEVEQYYSEHREEFPKPQLPPETDETPPPSTEESPDGTKPEGESEGGAGDPPPAQDETQLQGDTDKPPTADRTLEQEPANGESSQDGAPAEAPADTDDAGTATEEGQDPAAPAPEGASEAATDAAGQAATGESDGETPAKEEPAADATSDSPAAAGPEEGTSYADPDSLAERGTPVAFFDVTALEDDPATGDSDAALEDPETAPGAPRVVSPAAANDAADHGAANADGESQPPAEQPDSGASTPGVGSEAPADEPVSDAADQPDSRDDVTAEDPPDAAATGEEAEQPAAPQPDPSEAEPGEAEPGEAEAAGPPQPGPDLRDPDKAEGPTTEEGTADRETTGGEETTPPKSEDQAAEPEPEYRSLEEVSDEIRRKLASQAAQDRLDDALEAVRGEITQYYQDRALWQAKLLDDPKAPAPEFPDIESIAKKQGLSFGTVPEVDIFEIEQYEIGKAEDFVWFQRPGSPMPQQQRTTLASDAFTKGLPLYKPKRFPGQSRNPMMFSRGNAETQYVYWKTGETEEHVPELKDVRNEVVTAWKAREALKLAKKAADEAAEQGRQSGSSLASKFGEEKVIETGATRFYDTLSVMQARMRQGYLQTSEIEGIEGVGEEFMRTVFDQQAGDVCVAVNQPETEVCVVRIKTDRPSREELQNNFKEALTKGAPPGLPYEVQLLAANDVGRFLRDWLQDFDKKMEVDWKRDPRPGSQQEI